MIGLKIYELQKNKPHHFGKGTPYTNETDFAEKIGVRKLRDMCKLNEIDLDTAIHKLAAAALIRQVGLELVGNIMVSMS